MLESISENAFMNPVSLLIFVGLILMVVEIFTPGFTLAGWLGGLCFFFAIVLGASSFAQAVWLTLLLLVLLVVFFLLLWRSASKGKISKTPIILKESATNEKYFEDHIDNDIYLGREGVVVTTLRPSGVALIDEKKVDVVSDSEFIQSGTKIRVIKVDGYKVVVQIVSVN